VVDVKAQTGIETLIPVLHMVASMCTPSTLVAMVSGMKFLRSQIVVSGFWAALLPWIGRW